MACSQSSEAFADLSHVPDSDANTWDLSNEDFEAWEAFLRRSMDKALDFGIDSIAVLDHVADSIARDHSPTVACAARAADLLMFHLDMPDARQLPDAVLAFVNETLLSSYPPEPRNRMTAMWMLRSLTRVVDTCPAELALGLLEAVQEGVCAWVADEFKAVSPEEYASDVRRVPFLSATRLGADGRNLDSAAVSDRAVQHLGPPADD